jgi:ribosomal protein S26
VRVFDYDTAHISPSKEDSLARKTVLVCDNCGKEVEEGKGATMRVTYSDARRGAKQADLCDSCSGKMPGRAAARRGRRPKSATA